MTGRNDSDAPWYSHLSYPGDIRQPEAWEYIVKILAFYPVALIGTVGNILVTLIVIKNKFLHSTANYFIMNLAMADLLTTLFESWVFLVDDLTEGWVLGPFYCKFHGFIGITCLCASVFTLTVISVDRYIAVVFPLKALILNPARIYVTVGAIWLLAAITGIPLWVFREEKRRQWKDHLEIWCWEDPETLKVYWSIVLCVLIWLPLMTMCAAYASIMRKIGIPPEVAQVSTRQQMKRKVTQMLMIVLIAFIACWLPFQVMVFYRMYNANTAKKFDSWYKTIYYVAHYLAYANSAINPIIFAAFNENFRKGFRKTFHIPTNAVAPSGPPIPNLTLSPHCESKKRQTMRINQVNQQDLNSDQCRKGKGDSQERNGVTKSPFSDGKHSSVNSCNGVNNLHVPSSVTDSPRKSAIDVHNASLVSNPDSGVQSCAEGYSRYLYENPGFKAS